MGVYRSVCYKVEDVFVKMLSRKKDLNTIQMKVTDYRNARKGNKRRKDN